MGTMTCAQCGRRLTHADPAACPGCGSSNRLIGEADAGVGMDVAVAVAILRAHDRGAGADAAAAHPALRIDDTGTGMDGVIRVGAAFALVIPAVYTIETQKPETGFHPHAKPETAVSSGTELVVLMIVVVVFATWVFVGLRDLAGRWRPGGDE